MYHVKIRFVCRRPSTVKLRVNELESSSIGGGGGGCSNVGGGADGVGATSSSSPDRRSATDPGRRNLVLNLTTQFEGAADRNSTSAANSPSDDVVLLVNKPLPAAESPKFSRRIAVNKPPATTAVCGGQQKREGAAITAATAAVAGDLFSSRLDRVFEREERKQCREPSGPDAASTLAGGGCDVSRQNSWSSYDSAVVLRGDVVSRHSSWGSCDTRTLPSRNSSWGSYDVVGRPATMTCMQYVSERGERSAAAELSAASSSATAAIKPTAAAAGNESPCYYHHHRPNYGQIKRSKQKEDQPLKLLLPNCYLSSPTLGQGAPPRLADRATASQPNISGLGGGNGGNNKHSSSLVKSLKEEFEAKAGDCCAMMDRPPRKNSGGGGGSGNGSGGGSGGGSEDDVVAAGEHVKSLPTSPVSEHPKVTQRPSPAASMEDISVRKLVGKYENGRTRSKTFVQDSGCPRKPHQQQQQQQQQPPVPVRVSNVDATAAVAAAVHVGLPKFAKFECNPVVLPIQQSDIRASVNRAANNKLQQGKSHPLTKLSFKQHKVNSTVYNSM